MAFVQEASLSGGACRDIVEKHAMCKLNGTDTCMGEYGDEKVGEEIVSQGELKEKFKVNEMSSISTLEFAWENKSLWSVGGAKQVLLGSCFHE